MSSPYLFCYIIVIIIIRNVTCSTIPVLPRYLVDTWSVSDGTVGHMCFFIIFCRGREKFEVQPLLELQVNKARTEANMT